MVAATAVAAAIGAVPASCEPTGWRPADIVWSAGFAVVVVLAGAKARRWTWLTAAAVGAAAAPDLAVAAPALLGLVITLVSVVGGRRTRVVGAVVLGLALQSLLRLDLDDPHGLASLVAAAGVLPALVSGYRRASPPTDAPCRWARWPSASPPPASPSPRPWSCSRPVRPWLPASTPPSPASTPPATARRPRPSSSSTPRPTPSPTPTTA